MRKVGKWEGGIKVKWEGGIKVRQWFVLISHPFGQFSRRVFELPDRLQWTRLTEASAAKVSAISQVTPPQSPVPCVASVKAGSHLHFREAPVRAEPQSDIVELRRQSSTARHLQALQTHRWIRSDHINQIT